MLKYGIAGPIRCFWRRQRRLLGGIGVPFKDDLILANDEDFGLSDFQHYREAGTSTTIDPQRSPSASFPAETMHGGSTTTLEDVAALKRPVVVVSKLSNPFVNLALEDYLYNAMEIPQETTQNYNRLLFYTNSPCVVIGKNQNPWKEVNLPLLNSLRIPLVRRRSGGGTVVHDHGNVNFSFMTTKAQFDRFKFAELVKDAVNSSGKARYELEVNSRGDITTVVQPDGVNYKTSGSAYKLSKGKSYHHGTMLLNLRLDILGKLLSRDVTKLGVVDAMNSIDSVKSKVVNIDMDSDDFVQQVTQAFENEYGNKGIEEQAKEGTKETGAIELDYDQNELFGLTDFVEANSMPEVTVFTVDESTELPESVLKTSNELQQWSWKFGATPKFTHELTNSKYGFRVKFHVGKEAHLEEFTLDFDGLQQTVLPKEAIVDSFEFLKVFISENQLEYTGSNVAGFITDDVLSDWVGESIDATS